MRLEILLHHLHHCQLILSQASAGPSSHSYIKSNWCKSCLCTEQSALQFSLLLAMLVYWVLSIFCVTAVIHQVETCIADIFLQFHQHEKIFFSSVFQITSKVFFSHSNPFQTHNAGIVTIFSPIILFFTVKLSKYFHAKAL